MRKRTLFNRITVAGLAAILTLSGPASVLAGAEEVSEISAGGSYMEAAPEFDDSGSLSADLDTVSDNTVSATVDAGGNVANTAGDSGAAPEEKTTENADPGTQGEGIQKTAQQTQDPGA